MLMNYCMAQRILKIVFATMGSKVPISNTILLLECRYQNRWPKYLRIAAAGTLKLKVNWFAASVGGFYGSYLQTWALQYDKIGLLLKSLGDIFTFKIRLIIGQLFVLFKNFCFYVKTALATFWATLIKKLQREPQLILHVIELRQKASLNDS